MLKASSNNDNIPEIISVFNNLLNDKNFNKGLSDLVALSFKGAIDDLFLESKTNNVEEIININYKDKPNFSIKDTSTITTE